MKDRNLQLYSDAYKFCHHKQYLPNTQVVKAYLESRPGAQFDETVFFGLQPILDSLAGQVVTPSKTMEAKRFLDRFFRNSGNVFNPMWTRILQRHDGHLPLRIKAVPEGTVVPVGNVMMTVENTDNDCGPLTNFVETMLTHVWYPSTVATLSRHVKRMIGSYLQDSGGDMSFLEYMLHDFGFRGCTCPEQAEIGGMAHLVNFLGTDTTPGILAAMDHYGADVEDFAPGVPATEHSVMTAGGRPGEPTVLGHILSQHPTGPLSVVGDSYNIFMFAKHYVCELFKQEILDRDGLFVLRPDSGDPVVTVLKLLNILGDGYGVRINDACSKVIDGPVRLLWGDGLEVKTINQILAAMCQSGWAAENLACFGMGGGLLQKVNRDTQRFAFKCCAQKRDGGWYDIFKDPLDQSKCSKKGHLKLIRDPEFGMQTVAEEAPGEDLLQTVFENGKIVKRYSWDEVKRNAAL